VTEEEPLPSFRYHPDPIGTGSVKPSDGACRACGLARGLIYTGPVYSTEELDQAICPWCIADGAAAKKFDAEFTDIGWGVPKEIPEEVLIEVSRRTPGFSGWQQEHWLYHHSNAAAFLGPVGASELANYPDALQMLSHEHDQYRWTPEQVADYLKALHRDHSPTAYLFRCLVCGLHLAYSDFD
jgi:uncharacterized protein